MQATEKLFLRWNDFHENTIAAFKDLKNDSEFTDVTLACEDGQQIETHKVVLFSSSPFLKNLLKKNKHPHPLIYVRGLKFEDLANILDFLYLGEVRVFQENLESFLELAKELQLKGLTEKEEVISKDCNEVSPQEKKQKEESYFLPDNENKKEIPTTVSIRDNKMKLEDLDDQIESMMMITDKVDQRGYTLVMCSICCKELTKSHMKDHIESKHLEGLSHSCDTCGKTSKTRVALRMHKRNQHRT